MHPIGGARFWTALLPLAVAAWLLAAHGRTAAAAEDPRAAGTNAVSIAPYLSAGVALVRARDTRFVDGADAGHAALYGSPQRFDAGAFDDGLRFHLAAGVRLPYRLRAQLELGRARALDWRATRTTGPRARVSRRRQGWTPGSFFLPGSTISRDGTSPRAAGRGPF